VFAAAGEEVEKKHGFKLGEAGVPGVRPVPFDEGRDEDHDATDNNGVSTPQMLASLIMVLT
jgi:hypothetical protein